MKHFFLLLLACVLLSFSATAQTAIAKLKYEDAEEAFTKGEYVTTLTRLDEAEKILGVTNPRILYLRIVATGKLVKTNHPFITFSKLQALRKNSALYLAKYENLPDNEDKYREVYKVNESLQIYPNTQQSWDFVNAVADKHKFKRIMTLQEFAVDNPEAALLVNGRQRKLDYGTMYIADRTSACGPGPVFCSVSVGGIFNYMYDFACKPSEQERTVIMNSLIEEAKKYVEARYLTIDLSAKKFLKIDVPGAKAQLSYSKDESTSSDGSTVYKIWLYMD